ncbi:hypothetical protein DICSQDRAFT_157198 [Dichomitus squalens LYAD-421 SS1]|uniref:Uncharacterized protein n=1 Tax=Dichomitus squalens (strain LYAD-421) TaxID=732165 RepID=R7SNQ6_DICSQ|nr:uncharacterized protein DICSQDRAFT_157198 [Dichomitus squalens LYAD-421 SS1]EJF57701.1 hypothetical protein DICSQDRAFT_157198 [Dichomitus squalens LYAD-421 SS1]
MHAAALSNVARRRLVHGAAVQTAAASTSAASVSPASALCDAPRAPRVRSHDSHACKASVASSCVTSSSGDISSVSSQHHATRPRRQSRPRAMPTSLPSFGTDKLPHIRALHTSTVVRRPDESNPNSFERRRQELPTSAWSRPPRPSQDADDNTVPSYYVERKKQRDQISQRKEEEGGLMNELNAGILSEGLAAQTKTREEKIPVEVRLPDGTVTHPSGFEPPTAETEFHPVAAKVPTEEHPLLSTVKQPWEEREFVEAGAEPIQVDQAKEAEWIKRMVLEGTGGNGVVSGVSDIGAERPRAAPVGASSTAADRSKITTSAWDTPARSASKDDPDSVVPPFYIERRKQRDSISERKEEEGGLMYELNAGLLSDEVAAHIREREEKIPVEVILEDGTVAHPSGFVPPTAETDFHPVAAKPGDAPKQPWVEILANGNGKKSA